jgi:RNA polymerase sigma factor (sigma-70 family)
MPEIPPDPTPAELSRLRSGIRIMALHDLRDADLAEEVAQETLVRLVQALREGRLQDPANLGAFTRAIARHVIVDTLRARQRFTETGKTAELASEEDSLGALVSAEQAARVRAALQQLSAGDREILRLSFFEGLTPQQLAERTGEPSSRVRKRKERALERLRKVFLERSGHGTATRPTQLAEAPSAVSRPGMAE